MAFDVEGNITNDQYRLEARFIRPVVGDMVHGAEGYIADDAWWVDEHGKAWINTQATLFSEAPDDLEELEKNADRMVRCIRIEKADVHNREFDSWIIDSSFYGFLNDKKLAEDESKNIKDVDFTVDVTNLYISRRVNYRPTNTLTVTELEARHPVIFVATNETALQEITKSLKRQFCLVLGKCGIRMYMSRSYAGVSDEYVDEDEPDEGDDESADDFE